MERVTRIGPRRRWRWSCALSPGCVPPECNFKMPCCWSTSCRKHRPTVRTGSSGSRTKTSAMAGRTVWPIWFRWRGTRTRLPATTAVPRRRMPTSGARARRRPACCRRKSDQKTRGPPTFLAECQQRLVGVLKDPWKLAVATGTAAS